MTAAPPPSGPPADVIDGARALITEVAQNRERRLLWLAGSARWTLGAAKALVAALGIADLRWIGERGGAADPNRRTVGLGTECGLLVVDAWAGLDLDALGAAVGTLRGGGLLVLLTPPAADWPEWPDPAGARIATFPYAAAHIAGRTIRRLCRLLDTASVVLRIDGPDEASGVEASGAETSGAEASGAETSGTGPRALESAGESARSAPSGRMPTNPDEDSRGSPATRDQANAIDAILAVARGRAHRPLVITADRGRGKSAAMGLAAARLAAAGHTRILLTAPRRGAAEAVLRHAGSAAPRYLAPDALLAEAPPADLLPADLLPADLLPADLLLVDEAAAIPAPLLAAMLRRCPRVVFATTVHGYEGTGRGFDVRFRAVLDRLTPGWRSLKLRTPIRWADGDPLEALVNRALLLDAEPAPDEQVAGALEGEPAVTVETADRDAIADDAPLLTQVFGLLVLGHYQTRPSDLRQLLDGPDIALHLLRTGERVLATAVSGREGRLPADLLAPIFEGRRRPHGHLLPQTLSAHGGLFDAPRLGCRRILRIAVRPAARRRGLGRALIEAIAEQAAADGDDLLGASFGATPGLVSFWRRCGLWPVQLGSRRNAASGVHAAVVLRPLSAAGRALYGTARARLLPRLDVLLSGPLRDLEPAVVAALLHGAPTPAPALDAIAQRELHAFAEAALPLDAALPALHALVRAALPDALAQGSIPPDEAELLIAAVLQRRPAGDAAGGVQARGKAAAISRLRRAASRLNRPGPV